MISKHRLFRYKLLPFRRTTLSLARSSSAYSYNPNMSANFGDEEQRKEDPTSHEQRFDQEKAVKRNPHPDFKKVEASRPDWSEKSELHFTKTKKPGWKLGEGASDGGKSLKKKQVEIDPYEEGRPAIFNYKLLISGIIPRPIGFVSTRSEDGTFPLVISVIPNCSNNPLIPRRFPHRLLHKPRALLLHSSNKSRPTPVHHRLRRRIRQCQGHLTQPCGKQRMHHQHNQRALPRSRQCNRYQRPLWHLRMVSLWPHTRAFLPGQTKPCSRSSFLYRG